MMIAPTEILFFRWVTLTEQKWVTFRERRRCCHSTRRRYGSNREAATGFSSKSWFCDCSIKAFG